jgi:hypothetical protein
MIGDRMAYEKVSIAEAYDWQMRSAERGYFTALHEYGIKPDFSKLYGTQNAQLHAAKRLVGYE